MRYLNVLTATAIAGGLLAGSGLATAQPDTGRGGGGDAASVDPAFGTDGFAAVTAGQDQVFAEDVVVDADGRTLLIGGTFVETSDDPYVARLTEDGQLDSMFDDDGQVTVGLGLLSGLDAVARAGAVQADGKIVITGEVIGAATGIFVVRLNADGSSDSSFGDNGGVLIGAERNALGNAVAIQPDGKIVVAGSADSTQGGGAKAAAVEGRDVMVFRLTAEGDIDTGFGSNGVVSAPIVPEADEAVNAVAVQDNGGLVIAGQFEVDEQPSVLLERLNADGTFDENFVDPSDRGQAVAPLRAVDVAIASSGRIVVVSQQNISGPDLGVLLAFTAGGLVDQAFGDGGGVEVLGSGDSDVTDVEVQDDGGVVVLGATGAGANLAAFRYRADGSPDTTFGGDGTVEVPTAEPGFVPAGGAVDASGRIVLAGNRSVGENGVGILATRLLGPPAKLCNGLGVTVDLALGQQPTSGSDVILGTRGADAINGLRGNDVICGAGGADVVNGGGGGDTILGGRGRDSLLGSKGRDTLLGGAGRDILDGGRGVDSCDGGPGADTEQNCELVP